VCSKIRERSRCLRDCNVGATKDKRAHRRRERERRKDLVTGDRIYVSNDENSDRDRRAIYNIMCNE